MKRLVKNKNILIIILCITIILLSIGYALIAIRLKEREATDKIYDVSITNIQEGTAIRGGEVLPTSKSDIINGNKTADFTFNLQNPGDTLTYIITIKNNGNLKAKIDGLAESPDYINNDDEASRIYPGEEINLTITVEFSNSGTAKEIKTPYQVSILTSCIY